MIEPRLKVLQGTPFEGRGSALLVVSPRLARAGHLTARAEFTLTFLSVPVEKGIVVPSHGYIASTGARVEIRIEGGHFAECSRGRSLKTHKKIVSSAKSVVELAPKVSYKTADEGEATLSAGKVRGEKGTSETTEFEDKEYPVATSCTGHYVSWSVDMPRGAKAVRDYLEGNATLWAACQWVTGDRPIVHSTVYSLDRRFFNSKRERLGPIFSLVLILKLKALGRPLPAFGKIVFQMSIQGAP